MRRRTCQKCQTKFSTFESIGVYHQFMGKRIATDRLVEARNHLNWLINEMEAANASRS